MNNQRRYMPCGKIDNLPAYSWSSRGSMDGRGERGGRRSRELSNSLLQRKIPERHGCCDAKEQEQEGSSNQTSLPMLPPGMALTPLNGPQRSARRLSANDGKQALFYSW
jgi:hypothetical protein